MKNPARIVSSLRASALALCAVGAASVAAAQSALYTQNFDNIAGSGTRTPINQQFAGWNAYISSKAFNMADKTQYNFNNDAPTPAGGSLQANSYSFSTTAVPGYQGGYLTHATATAGGGLGSPIIASVYTGLSINLANYSDLSFSWQGNASAVGPSTRLLLQVGGQWYATNATFTLRADAGFSAATDLDKTGNTASFTFSDAASAWREFTLEPGNATNLYEAGNGTMSIGGTASGALSGTITGVGLFTAFAENGSQTTVRYDQLNIIGTAIPEPAQASLLVGLCVVGALTCSRRRRSA